MMMMKIFCYTENIFYTDTDLIDEREESRTGYLVPPGTHSEKYPFQWLYIVDLPGRQDIRILCQVTSTPSVRVSHILKSTRHSGFIQAICQGVDVSEFCVAGDIDAISACVNELAADKVFVVCCIVFLCFLLAISACVNEHKHMLSGQSRIYYIHISSLYIYYIYKNLYIYINMLSGQSRIYYIHISS